MLVSKHNLQKKKKEHQFLKHKIKPSIKLKLKIIDWKSIITCSFLVPFFRLQLKCKQCQVEILRRNKSKTNYKPHTTIRNNTKKKKDDDGGGGGGGGGIESNELWPVNRYGITRWNDNESYLELCGHFVRSREQYHHQLLVKATKTRIIIKKKAINLNKNYTQILVMHEINKFQSKF